jgi:hypothetical protein
MNSKILIVLGIIGAHGAVAAGWVQQETPQPRAAASTASAGCSQNPNVLPDFTPRPMLLAALIVEPLGESMQP